jgi:hypothetical protein
LFAKDAADDDDDDDDDVPPLRKSGAASIMVGLSSRYDDATTNVDRFRVTVHNAPCLCPSKREEDRSCKTREKSCWKGKI